MGRIAYKCTCDKWGCAVEITSGNDENDVQMNGARYVYCPDCYSSFLSMWEKWDTSVKKEPVKRQAVFGTGIGDGSYD